jgi:hypothetical protein
VSAQLSLDPVLGWRVWRVGDDGLLEAVVWGSPWHPRQRFHASCEDAPSPFWPGSGLAPHRPPARDCECGIYAFKRRADAELLAREKVDGRPLALGRASLWGRVVETERGYRAEFAYPYDVEVLGGSSALAGLVRSRYAVDAAPAPPVVALHRGGG